MAIKHVHEHDREVKTEPDPELEAELRDQLGGDAELVDLFKFGMEMEIFVKDNEVGRYLVNRANQDLQENIRLLLDQVVLDTQEARHAHQEARTALAVLSYISEAVSKGGEAEETIRQTDELTQQPEA